MHLTLIIKGKLQNRVFFSHFTIKYNDPLYTTWHITISPICFCHLQSRLCVCVDITISSIITTKSPLPHAMFARHRGHGTLLRTKHQKWRMAIALPWRISLSLRFNSFRFPVCVSFQVHYCHTSMAVIISSIITSPSNVQLHANLHGRRMFVSDASYSTLRSFPYAVP